jgi:hypothetical protein
MGGVPLPIMGIKSINYSEDLEPGDVYGTAPHKLGRTRGKHNANCDFEMYRLEWENLKVTLGIAGVGYGEVAFDIFVTYSENFSPVVTDQIVGARITKCEFSNSDGTDTSTVKLTCNVLNILTNLVSAGGPGSIVAPTIRSA